VTVRPGSRFVDEFLRKVYEFYADYVLKVSCGAPLVPALPGQPPCVWVFLQNAFYETDMPIRCEKFDTAIEAYVRAVQMSL
jgi:Sybindin-like family